MSDTGVKVEVNQDGQCKMDPEEWEQYMEVMHEQESGTESLEEGKSSNTVTKKDSSKLSPEERRAKKREYDRKRGAKMLELKRERNMWRNRIRWGHPSLTEEKIKELKETHGLDFSKIRKLTPEEKQKASARKAERDRERNAKVTVKLEDQDNNSIENWPTEDAIPSPMSCDAGDLQPEPLEEIVASLEVAVSENTSGKKVLEKVVKSVTNQIKLDPEDFEAVVVGSKEHSVEAGVISSANCEPDTNTAKMHKGANSPTCNTFSLRKSARTVAAKKYTEGEDAEEDNESEDSTYQVESENENDMVSDFEEEHEEADVTVKNDEDNEKNSKEGVEYLKCKFCNERYFKDKYGLKFHFKLKHPTKIMAFTRKILHPNLKCKVCGKLMRTRKGLQIHMIRAHKHSDLESTLET